MEKTWNDGGRQDSNNSTENMGRKNSFPGLPSFGMPPIYPVFVRKCECACVGGMLAGRLSAYKYHITTEGKAGSSPSCSRPNKHRSSSTLEVRGKARTNAIPQKATLLSQR